MLFLTKLFVLGKSVYQNAFLSFEKRLNVDPSFTVLLKCKLTVSTRNSIVDPRSFRESSFELREFQTNFGNHQKFCEMHCKSLT